MKNCVVFIFAISLLGCGESKIQPYFRAKFNNDVVKNNIYEFEYWNEIQSKEIDIAFEKYQKGPYVQKRFPEEAATIFKLIEQGGLLGVAAEAHEKWEVLEYLKVGYSLENISNGKAYEEYKPLAHAEARFKELKFYQFWYRQLFSDNPPAMRAFLFVHPILQVIVRDIYKIEVTTEVIDMLVSELGRHEDIMRSEKCSREDIMKCIIFFETAGYNYKAQRDLFLERGLVFLREIG